ncbi:MAG: hypothetical protein KAH18_02415 [Psychromonas sp.]|nr:hypothetical protein [Psychromonas sp.]
MSINPEKTITFIDIRYIKDAPSKDFKAAPDISTCYGQTCMEFISQKYSHNTKLEPKQQDPQNLSDFGLRILVGEHMMMPFMTAENRSLIIYQELTHHIPDTIETGLIRHFNRFLI